jgi:hypothetical protein
MAKRLQVKLQYSAGTGYCVNYIDPDKPTDHWVLICKRDVAERTIEFERIDSRSEDLYIQCASASDRMGFAPPLRKRLKLEKGVHPKTFRIRATLGLDDRASCKKSNPDKPTAEYGISFQAHYDDGTGIKPVPRSCYPLDHGELHVEC